MQKMLTIHKDSFDMIEKDVTSGTLEKSKILNCLFWKSHETNDPVTMVGLTVLQTTLGDCKPSPQPIPSVTDSVLDKLDKHTVWNCLSVPSVEDDGCEYCTMHPIERQLIPKHQIYTNGKLTCPLLLTLETLKETKQTNSMAVENKERAVKKRSFRRAK